MYHKKNQIIYIFIKIEFSIDLQKKFYIIKINHIFINFYKKFIIDVYYNRSLFLTFYR